MRTRPIRRQPAPSSSERDLFAPVRRPRRNPVSNICVVNIVGIASIHTESWLETSVVLTLLFNPAVRRIVEQPIKIVFTDDDGKSRTYVPDFYVELERGWLLIEVKHRYLLRKNWPEIRKKLEAGRRYARLRGGDFRLITNLGVDPVTLYNARFLLKYLRDFLSPAERQAIETVLDRDQPQTIGQLLAILTANENGPSDWPRLVWHLVARRELRVDLSRQVSADMELTAPCLLAPLLDRQVPDHLQREHKHARR